VRWLAFILSELLLLGGVLYGLSLFSGVNLFGPVDAAAALERPAALLAPARPPEVGPITIRPAESAVDTFLGMSDALLSARMRKSAVKSLHFNHGGSSISFRIDFADGSRAAFKPTQTNPQTVPRKEVAAYRLSRLLGLNLVAPAVLRPLHRDEVFGKLSASSRWAQKRIEAETMFDEHGDTVGSLAYWIPTVVDLHLDTTDGVNRWTAWLHQGVEIPPEKERLMAELSTLLLFDLLQNNSDRFSGGNILGSPDGHTLYYMDNAFGFQTDPEGNLRCWNYLRRAQKFSRSLVRALSQLDRQTLNSMFAEEPGPPLLSDAEQAALLSRRDLALSYIQSLSEEYGSDRVLAFP
jgi:hypothetical protein